jgi:hypothetical protein
VDQPQVGLTDRPPQVTDRMPADVVPRRVHDTRTIGLPCFFGRTDGLNCTSAQPIDTTGSDAHLVFTWKRT